MIVVFSSPLSLTTSSERFRMNSPSCPPFFPSLSPLSHPNIPSSSKLSASNSNQKSSNSSLAMILGSRESKNNPFITHYLKEDGISINTDIVPIYSPLDRDILATQFAKTEPIFGYNSMMNLVKLKEKFGHMYILSETFGDGNCGFDCMLQYLCPSFQLLKKRFVNQIPVFSHCEDEKYCEELTFVWKKLISKFRVVMFHYMLYLKASRQPSTDSENHLNLSVHRMLLLCTENVYAETQSLLFFSLISRTPIFIFLYDLSALQNFLQRLFLIDPFSYSNNDWLKSIDFREDSFENGQISNRLRVSNSTSRYACFLHSRKSNDKSLHFAFLDPIHDDKLNTIGSADIKELYGLNMVLDDLLCVQDGAVLRSYDLFHEVRDRISNIEGDYLNNSQGLKPLYDILSEYKQVFPLLNWKYCFTSFLVDSSQYEGGQKIDSSTLNIFKPSLFNDDFSKKEFCLKTYAVQLLPNLCKFNYEKFLFIHSQTFKDRGISSFDCYLQHFCKSRQLCFMNWCNPPGNKVRFSIFGSPEQELSERKAIRDQYLRLISLLKERVFLWFETFLKTQEDNFLDLEENSCFPKNIRKCNDWKIFSVLSLFSSTPIFVFEYTKEELVPSLYFNPQLFGKPNSKEWFLRSNLNVANCAVKGIFRSQLDDPNSELPEALFVLNSFLDSATSCHFSMLIPQARAFYNVPDTNEFQLFSNTLKSLKSGQVFNPHKINFSSACGSESSCSELSGSESRGSESTLVVSDSYDCSSDEHIYKTKKVSKSSKTGRTRRVFEKEDNDKVKKFRKPLSRSEPTFLTINRETLTCLSAPPLSIRRTFCKSVEEIVQNFCDGKKSNIPKSLSSCNFPLMFILLEPLKCSYQGNLKRNLTKWAQLIPQINTSNRFSIIFSLPLNGFIDEDGITNHLTCVRFFEELVKKRSNNYDRFFFLQVTPSFESSSTVKCSVIHYYYFVLSSKTKLDNEWPLQVLIDKLVASKYVQLHWDCYKDSYLPLLSSIICLVSLLCCFPSEYHVLTNESSAGPSTIKELGCFTCGLEFEVLNYVFVLLKNVYCYTLQPDESDIIEKLNFQASKSHLYRRFKHACDIYNSLNSSCCILGQFLPFDENRYSSVVPKRPSTSNQLKLIDESFEFQEILSCRFFKPDGSTYESSSPVDELECIEANDELAEVICDSLNSSLDSEREKGIEEGVVDSEMKSTEPIACADKELESSEPTSAIVQPIEFLPSLNTAQSEPTLPEYSHPLDLVISPPSKRKGLNSDASSSPKKKIKLDGFKIFCYLFIL